MKTSFTDKNCAKILVKQHEATFACCPPPIILGQKNKKLSKADQATPVHFKIKESGNSSERAIEMQPLKDGHEWEVSDFKLNFASVAEQVGWNTPKKKQINFAHCLAGNAKERCSSVATKCETANTTGNTKGA